MAEITCLAKLGMFKIAHVSGTSQTGNAYEFYSLERSYQDANKNWQSERITLRPAEMLAVAGLLTQAARHIMQVQAQAQNAKMQQGTAGKEPSEDVPF